jgi:drug/metabolite transporter (DMT)-like permease
VTVEVPVTIALAAVVMGQRLTPAQLVGAAFVVGAIAVLQLPARLPRLRLVAARARVPAAAPGALAEAA